MENDNGALKQENDAIDSEIEATLLKLQELQAKKRRFPTMDAKLSEDPVIPWEKPYNVLKDIFTLEEAQQARDFFTGKKSLDCEVHCFQMRLY
jgi:hypothetical protein